MPYPNPRDFAGNAVLYSKKVARNRRARSSEPPEANLIEFRNRKTAPDCLQRLHCDSSGLAMAARMLDRLEKRGKEVTPGNAAYHTILHLCPATVEIAAR